MSKVVIIIDDDKYEAVKSDDKLNKCKDCCFLNKCVDNECHCGFLGEAMSDSHFINGCAIKVYVITEYICREGILKERVLGIVSKEIEARKLCRELSVSVYEYNITNEYSEKICYGYEGCDIDDLSTINEFIERNKDNRKFFTNKGIK